MGIKNLLREPLLQFLLLGSLIFAVAEWRARTEDSRSHTITVDAATVQYQQNLYRVQYGVDPDAETLQFLVDNHVREEVLFREALKLGLAQNDEIIHRRLVQKMEFLLEDGRTLPVADTDTLKSWYSRHAAKYQTKVQASFRHLYFSSDVSGDAAAQQRAMAVLAKANGADLKVAQGDRFPLESDYRDLDDVAVKQLFGESPMAAAIFTAAPGLWVGPLRSGLGWHLLKVEQRSEAGMQPFEAVIDQVRNDWLDAQRKQLAAAELARLMDQYHVVKAP